MASTNLHCHNVTSDSPLEFRLLPSNNRDPAEKISPMTVIALLRIVLVIILRVGSLLVQVGSVPVTNVNLILLHHVVDLCWVSLVYFLVGTVIAYTGDHGRLIGGGYWIADKATDKDDILFGWQAAILTATICTSSIVGRMHTVGTLIVCGILCGIVQPFIIHWAWTDRGWMSQNYLQEISVHFHDYGGAAVVHIVGGVTGLIGCLVLGRRLLILQEIDDASISVGSVGSAFAGHLLVVVGFQTLLISHTTPVNDKTRNVNLLMPVNTLLTISSCALIVVALHFLKRDRFNHWTVMRCMQAITAGAVTVSAGADVYTPVVAILLGCVGGILFYFISKIIFESAIEDYCNVITIHIVSALLGIVIVPIFSTIGDKRTSVAVLLNIAWQLICLISIIGFTILVMLPVYLLLSWCGLMRNRSEYINHLRSSAVLERGVDRYCFHEDKQLSDISITCLNYRSFLKRMFRIDGETVLMQPSMPREDTRVVDDSVSRSSRPIARLEMSQQKDDGKVID